MRVSLSDGKEYEFAPLGFTRDAVDLCDQFEMMNTEGFSGSRLLRLLMVNMVDSLKHGGLSTEQAEAAVALVPLNDQGKLHEIGVAMGLIDSK